MFIVVESNELSKETLYQPSRKFFTWLVALIWPAFREGNARWKFAYKTLQYLVLLRYYIVQQTSSALM